MRELRFERNNEQMSRGAVAATLAPGMPDSGGSQFFICIFDQLPLSGQYTVFARVAEGLNVAQKISQVEADNTVPKQRVVMTKVTIRDKGRGCPRAVHNGVSRGAVEISRRARDVDGDHHFSVLTRQGAKSCAQLPATRVGRVLRRHRVPPSRERIRDSGRLPADTDRAARHHAGPLHPEDGAGVQRYPARQGTVSLAHGDDPASGDTSFFIVLARTPALDGKYSAFGKVVEGLDVVEKLEQVPVNGETPTMRVELRKVTVSKIP
jgi:cyclophilin family peptidyl-prolyl cis-trans isomerase